MKNVGPAEELQGDVYESIDSDEDPDEDPEEDPEEEYEEYYEEVSEEESEADLEGEESNAEPNEETGPKTVDETVASEALNIEKASGKQRRSRWDIAEDQDGETGGGDKASKVRKTRWGSDVAPLQSTAPDQLLQTVSDSVESELVRKLKLKLVAINKEILSLEVHQGNPIEDESEKQKKKLVKKRQNILKELIILTSKGHKFSTKVFVPVKEYPSYNFIGLIIGPRGNTQKKMEVETGASIKLRGKGSCSLDRERKPNPSDNEDLHVWIDAPNKKSLDAAVAMVNKLLIPIDDGDNEFKRAQLRELATLNGTLNTCNVCNELGHRGYACPNRESTFEKVTACSKCGSFTHPVSHCPVSYGKVINEANLYVSNLPETVDDNFVKELFCPFGKINKVNVIKDINTGLNKGYGFVNFDSPADAASAVKHMIGYQLDGKMLTVRVAGILPPQPKFPVLSPFPSYPRLAAPWVGPPGLVRPPPQPGGFPALNPLPPYPRPTAAIPFPPNTASQTSPWAGPPSAYLSMKEPFGQQYNPSPSNMTSHLDSSVYPSKAPHSSSDLSKFPGDPDYRGSTSMFPGDPDYRGSGSSSLFSGDFDFS